MLVGSRPLAREIAAWMSWAAASILRSSVNCTVIFVELNEFTEFIDEMPAMVENSRSSGVATDDAIVSGLAPGTNADTEMVGYSTLGSAATGSARNAITPKRRMANVMSAVITGRSMNPR